MLIAPPVADAVAQQFQQRAKEGHRLFQVADGQRNVID